MNRPMQEYIHQLAPRFAKGARIVVTAHTHPDGDALGSVCAMVQFLRERRGADAVAVFPDALPDHLLALAGAGLPLLFFDRDPDAVRTRIRQCDGVILCDANAFSRTEGMAEALAACKGWKVLIDHHLNPDTDAFDLVFSQTDISSASELVYQLLCAFPEVDGDAGRLGTETGRYLLLGMTTDTNNFSNSVYPSTLRMAADLVEAGVDREALIDALYHRCRENRVRAMGWMQSRELILTPAGAAIMLLTRELQQRFDLADGETEGLVNIPLSIGRVRLSILLKETDQGHFRVSLRSKPGTSAQQCAVRYFHGGGHEQAAGGKLFFPGDIPGPGDAAAYVQHLTEEFLA